MDLSITIISYNCRDLLHKCLKSIREKIKPENLYFELIIVDNHSNDGTIDMIQKAYQDLDPLLISNPANYGVSRARNQAIKSSRGRYVLLLDADTEILSLNFRGLIDYMEGNKDIGILGCRMLDRNDEFYHSARTFPGPLAVLIRRLNHYGLFKNSNILRKHLINYYNDVNPIEVDYVIGAFQLIRKKAIDKIGLLDEKMFYGFEDTDYCIRMSKNDFKVVYYPSFSIKHYVGGITKKGVFNKMLFFHIKSYLILLRKHYFQYEKLA